MTLSRYFSREQLRTQYKGVELFDDIVPTNLAYFPVVSEMVLDEKQMRVDVLYAMSYKPYKGQYFQFDITWKLYDSLEKFDDNINEDYYLDEADMFLHDD